MTSTHNEDELMKNLLTNSKTLIASALIMGVALSPMAVNAAETTDAASVDSQTMKKGAHKKSNKQFRKMARYLKLTDEQRTEIKALRESMSAEKDVQKAEMQSFRTEVKALVSSDSFSDQAFADVYAQHEAALQEKALHRATMQNAIFQLLTEEQKVKWQEFKGKAKGKKGKSCK